MTDMTGVAKETFQVLLRFNYVVKLFDQDGMVVAEPTEARRMFAASPNLMVSLNDADDDSNIKLLFGKSTHAADIDGLLQALRTVATKYNMTFEPKQYGKEIDAKDYRNMVSISESLKEIDMHLCEGLYGTSRSSYLQLDHAKMIVHHAGPIDPTRVDARAHQIKAIFVENATGVRVQVPSNELSVGRSLTEHVNAGGAITDLAAKALLAETVESEPPLGEPPYLAENNEVVQDFLRWTEQFVPEQALTERYEEPDEDAATETAIRDFRPDEFLASSTGQDLLSDFTQYDADAGRITKSDLLGALGHYLRKYIEMHHDDFQLGFNGDTDSLARAVYKPAAEAIEQHGFSISDDETPVMPQESVPAGDELTREDILLPAHDQQAGLARASTKAVIHDDPSNPDDEELPDGDGIGRLQTLAGMGR